MASRARGYRQDWEREEFDETYDSQYPDDDVHGGVQLDHCKLYITNINRALNEEGLVTAFSKYGTLVKVHVSRDPIKRYALITFETPGEAKLAMMKLNKTEPLKLNIHIAHKKNFQDQKEDGRKFKHRESSSYRDDASVNSKGRRKQDDFTNGDNIDIEEALCDEDLGLDTDLELEMTQLKMKQLQLQQAQLQCKQQMLLLNRGGKKAAPKPNRCILPDGRIVVRNNSDKSDQPDHTYSSAAGDSLTLPSLQRESSRACLTCGAAADFYCAACALAQYCSQRCQQTDWNARHKFVCHNLACLNGSEMKPKEAPVDIGEPVLSPPAALRQPNLHQKRDYKQDDNKPKQNFNSNNKPSRANPTFKNKTFRHPMRQKEEKNGTDSFDGTEPKLVQNEKREPKKLTENQPEPKSESSCNIEADIQPEDHNVPPKPPGSVLDTTPKSKAMVPKHYALEALCAGESLLLSVDAAAADCAAGDGFVCLALHHRNQDDYSLLCGAFGADCDQQDDIEAGVGGACALLAAGEGAWYRARRLSRSHAALLDASRLLPLGAAARCVALPPRYERLPECCCRLRAPAVRLNDNLKCTLVSKTSDGYKVTLENAESGASVGEGEVSRWMPSIEYEATKPVSNVCIPEVPRPPLIDKSTVVIVDATAADKVYVRSAAPEDTKKFASVLQDGILVGMKGAPVSAPPRRGGTVVARHSDGHCYRALCTRTNVKQNKYLLEYIEYGNTDISTKEKIYPCPQDLDLSNKPTMVSLVKLNIDMALNKNGLEYLEQLRDGDVELVLHTAEQSPAPSGSLVQLTVLHTKESVNHKLKQLCSPDWKKIEEKGGDVVECEPLMYGSLQYQPLPPGPCRLAVLDVSTLRAGALGVCDAALRHDALLDDLTRQIAAYVESDLAKEPYLPRNEELCIAQCPPYAQYYRAVLCDHSPGSSEATVCFMDYNNVETVSVSTIRRMMPEFLTTPALACHAEIRGFPESPSDEQLARAVLHMKVDDEGRGELSVERCEAVDPGFYVLHAPALLAALQQH